MKTVIEKIFSILLLALFMLTMNSCEKTEFSDFEDTISSARSFDDGGDCDGEDEGNAREEDEDDDEDDITDDEDDDEDDGDITDDEDDDEDDTSRSLQERSILIK